MPIFVKRSANRQGTLVTVAYGVMKVAGRGKKIISVLGMIFLLGFCITAGIRSDSVELQETGCVAKQDVSGEMSARQDAETDEQDMADMTKESSPAADPAEENADKEEEQEQAVVKHEDSDSPIGVGVSKPLVMSDGLVGELSYRWPDQCIMVDDRTVLITGDCFYLDGLQRQKMFFLAKAPYFTLQEVYRHDYQEVPEVVENYADRYDCVNERMACPILLPDGYVYEADGRLYHLSKDFQTRDEICNIREIMGDLYQLYYKGAYENACDITTDLKKVLACTNEGLYEYDLESGEAKLLETASFKPHPPLEEGDCGCATPENDFIGPMRAEYAPDEQGYVFETVDASEDVWGRITGFVLRNRDGETLYQKQIDEYYGDFRWLETQEEDYLAVFYEEKEATWMDLVEADTGNSRTYRVPDGIFTGDSDEGAVALLNENELLYSGYDWETESYCYGIYRLQEGKRVMSRQSESESDWKVKVFAEGSYFQSIVKYLEPEPDGN